MLYKRYGGYFTEKIFEMPLEEGIDYINYAFKQKLEEKIYFRWCVGHYDQEIPYDEFKSKCIGKQDSKEQSEEEILKKVEQILRKD